MGIDVKIATSADESPSVLVEGVSHGKPVGKSAAAIELAVGL